VVQNLVSDYPRHLEALLAGHRVHNHVAMNADEMLGIEDTVFILKWSEIVSRSVLKKLSLGSTSKYEEEKLSMARHRKEARVHTCPAVSMISVAKSVPLYRMTLLNVFSIVG
jgi:hypothetical protein